MTPGGSPSGGKAPGGTAPGGGITPGKTRIGAGRPCAGAGCAGAAPSPAALPCPCGAGGFLAFETFTATAETTSGISTCGMSPAMSSAHVAGLSAGFFDSARITARVNGVSGSSGSAAPCITWYSTCPR